MKIFADFESLFLKKEMLKFFKESSSQLYLLSYFHLFHLIKKYFDSRTFCISLLQRSRSRRISRSKRRILFLKSVQFIKQSIQWPCICLQSLQSILWSLSLWDELYWYRRFRDHLWILYQRRIWIFLCWLCRLCWMDWKSVQVKIVTFYITKIEQIMRKVTIDCWLT